MRTREDIHTQQLELRKNVDEKKRLDSKLSTIMAQIKEHEQIKIELEETLSKEQLDLHKVDQFSLLNIYRKVKGTHDEVREKEYEEAAKAEVKLNEHERMLEDLKSDADKLKTQLRSFQSAETDWNHFIQTKKDWLNENDPETSHETEKHIAQYAELGALLSEMDEAIDAGEKAQTFLEHAEDRLSSAKSMSTWDTFLGGGLIATAMKHSRLDESERAIHDAQLHLRRFETELQDIQDEAAGGFFVVRDSFTTFADYVFDDIFSAWTIHNSINTSIENVSEVRRKVISTVQDLQARRQEVLERRKEVWNRYEVAVEQG